MTGKARRPGLGIDFTRLWTANAISNLGDGAAGVAAPLLVASLTSSPALVAGAVFVQQLPWLLFSLPAGVYVDRLERRWLLVAVNLARGDLRLRAEIGEGLRWLWHHPTLRLLAVCVGVMNLAGAGSFAIWVLWARERLGLQGVGFGALVTAYTAGGLLGTMLASRLEARFGPATLLRAGLCIEAGAQLSLALARIPWIAAPPSSCSAPTPPSGARVGLGGAARPWEPGPGSLPTRSPRQRVDLDRRSQPRQGRPKVAAMPCSVAS